MLLLIECGLLLLALAVAFIRPGVGNRAFLAIERRISRLAHHKLLSIVIIGLSVLVIRVGLLPWLPIPVPAVHDEFSYLLMGDTFAHGRLTNPTHPMWEHFETFHEIQKPTYASMYYPAQGLFLAMGQAVFGHPFWGVSISAALMCAAICWMLQGWVPLFWAFIGGWLAVIRIGILSYWANSYWGGAVAALGGALVLGALPRIERHHRVRNAVLMGMGFALLANTRPYESIFFSLPILVWLVGWMRNPNAPSRRILLTRVATPLVAIAVLTLGAMGYYFWRVTGSPWRPPFFVNVATYSPVPYFPWQSLKALPVYHHATMENFYLHWWMGQYVLARAHPLVLLLVKASSAWMFFLGPLLSFPLIAAAMLLPPGTKFASLSRRSRRLLIICGAILFGSLLPVYFNPHYIAAATSAFYALLVIAMQHLRRWAPAGKPAGMALARSTPLIAVVMFALCIGFPRLRAKYVPTLATWYSPFLSHSPRTDIIRQLRTDPGDDLIVVRYSPGHNPIDEWVFNDADIDAAKIVWARDMGIRKNEELIRYFHDRRVWVVDPDTFPVKLIPYDNGRDSSTLGRAPEYVSTGPAVGGTQ